MTKSKFLKTFLAGIVCAAGTATMSAQIEYDRTDFWNKPYIKEAFLSSYKAITDQKPSLSEDEQVMLKEAIALMSGDEAAGTKGDTQAALKLLLSGLNEKSSAALYFFVATLYHQDGNIEDATGYYESSVEKFPDFSIAQKNLGLIYVNDGKWEKAEERFKQAILLGIKDPTMYGLLGLCYVNLNKLVSAETAYRNAIVLDSKTADWKIGLAKTLLGLSKYEEAIAVLDEILVDKPEDDTIWSSQANAYLGLDKAEMALANHEIVDRLGKATPESLNLMGQIYLSRDLPELALAKFQKAIALDPSQPIGTHVNTAESMVGRGSFTQAAKLIASIRSKYRKIEREEELRLLRLETQVLLALDQSDKAVPILEKLVENDPLDGQALLLLARHYSSLDTVDGYAKADIFFERAEKVDDSRLNALLAWAQSYVSRERYGKAIPLLELYASLEPGKEFISRYLEQVRMVNRANAGL